MIGLLLRIRQCQGGHPIADHYRFSIPPGQPHAAGECPWPS